MSALRELTTTDSAATTELPEPRTGAAIDTLPMVISSRVHATPDRRTSSRQRRSSSGSVIVCGVSRCRQRPMTASRTSGPAYARSALPTPVAWSGSRPPTRVTMGTDPRPATFSMNSASRPSSTASWTLACVAS